MMIRCRLSSVKCGMLFSFRLGVLSIKTICFSAILWQRVKKGNGTPAPPSAIMIADQTQLWLTQFHEILTKRRKLLTANDVTLLTFLPFWRYGGRRGMYVSNS